jgi:biopolymer transport protein ExbD
MSRFDPPNVYERPQIQLIPLIDIIFFALIFFMILSVYYNIESQMDIRVPESSQSQANQKVSTDIVININSSGAFVVNGTNLTAAGLEDTLKRLTAVSSDQSIVIRADQKTFHKHVVQVLDICARNNIKDISFATSERK